MAFRLVHAQYDRESLRAYVELRDDDADGGEVIVAAIFTYRRTGSITKRGAGAGARDQGAALDEARLG